MALAHGYALPFEALRRTGVLAQNTADATNRATADGATKEAAGSCLDARALEVQQRAVVQPSILVVPQLTRNGVVLNQLPDTRTNFIQNNTMVGATGSVRPNLWDLGSLPSGFTISYSASGQTTAADGTLVDYIDVTVSGTALASGFLNLRQTTSPSPVSGNLLFASGMTYTASVYLALLSGSLTGVATNAMAVQEIANTTFVANTTFAPVTGITSALTRFTGTRPIDATGGADRVSVRWGHSITSGTSYDYTVRIASPQLEKGSVATPLIRTASGFVTVDMLGVARDGAPPDFTFTRATTATRVNASGLIESVASGVLRLDYPIGGGCPAALIEPSAQNLALQSAGFQVSGTWTPTNITVTTGSTAAFTAPDGSTDADLLTSTASGSARIIQPFSFVSGSTYTYSAFAKSGSGFFGLMMENGGVASGAAVIWNLNTGALAVSGVAGTGYTLQSQGIENYGNGWYRCRITVLLSVSVAGNIRANTSNGTMSTAVVQSDNGNNVYVWGAQIETGAIPTSYIPTTTGSATRNADVCTVSGVSGYIGQTEGTLYLDLSYERQGSSTNNRWLELFGSSDNIGLAVASTIRSIVNGQSDTLSGADTTSRFKIAWGYDSSGVVCFVNGTQFTLTNGGAQVITSLDSFRIDMSSTGGQRIFNNRIRAIALYTTRLTDDQLANLTRLT